MFNAPNKYIYIYIERERERENNMTDLTSSCNASVQECCQTAALLWSSGMCLHRFLKSPFENEYVYFFNECIFSTCLTVSACLSVVLQEIAVVYLYRLACVKRDKQTNMHSGFKWYISTCFLHWHCKRCTSHDFLPVPTLMYIHKTNFKL